VLSRWDPGVRRESFIQGVKMANLCGKSAPGDPFLSCEATMCSKEDPWSTGGRTLLEGKGFAGVYFFFPVAIDFLFPLTKVDSNPEYLLVPVPHPQANSYLDTP
jgi:hypothetical protein